MLSDPEKRARFDNGTYFEDDMDDDPFGGGGGMMDVFELFQAMMGAVDCIASHRIASHGLTLLLPA